MRHEVQRWDRVRATAEIVSAGIGQAGLTPTVAIQRLDNGEWLQAGGGSWGVAFAVNNMTEVDATNLPGLYEYDVASVRLTEVGLGTPEGFFYKVVEPNNAHLEYVKVDVDGAGDEVLGTGVITSTAFATSALEAIADAVWDEPIAGHLGAGSTGEALSNSTAYPSATAIADQVWVEQIGDHSGVLGSTAEALASVSLTPVQVADAVWNATQASYVAAGTTGESLNNAGAGAAPATIADAVWDESKTGHTAAGSMGLLMQTIAGMVQVNHRLKNPNYDPDGRLLSCELVVYPDSASADSDIGPLNTLFVTMTYDTDGNLESLLSKE